MNKIFTGIGTRHNTPDDIISLIRLVSFHLYKSGYWLYSGGAIGSDQAFESEYPDRKKIFVINEKHNGIVLKPEIYQEAEKIAKTLHPAWEYLSKVVKQLHTRNICQVLGEDLKTPTNFVVFYAEENKLTGEVSGGTATAVKLARREQINTYNLYFEETRKIFIDMVYNDYKNNIKN